MDDEIARVQAAADLLTERAGAGRDRPKKKDVAVTMVAGVGPLSGGTAAGASRRHDEAQRRRGSAGLAR
jgi:hypothetical protein